MKRYFPQSTNRVDKEALVECFLKENFENKEDALQMTILYFIHTFINSQLNASPVPLSDVKMVENGKYEFFSWGKVSYSGLMALRGQEFFVEKQLYRLGCIPQVLNVWMFEHCSNVDTKVVVKEGYNIPRILNWKVIAVRPQFNHFMTEMFSKIDQKFKDLERLMNDRFSEVLKSLQPKNETVEKEKVAKQSPKEGQHSDDVADFEGHSNPISPHFVSEKIEKMEVAMIHIYYFNYLKNILKQSQQEGDPSDDVVDVARRTSTDSLVKETDKPVEMEEDKANQAPSPLKNGEQYEKDDGIEKLSDIVVEKMQPLDSIILGREHDMTLIIYKPPPTTPDEDMISDTVILSTFATPKKDVSDVKKTSAPHSRKPSKIYRSPF
ncbi:hypothetical protein T459_15403 [Capsicum annuum]|uniref:DUF1985 domain-containing protein n=1 Tax=Capsicum annuum TaxID=4072 RepID=A0A2G2ZK67_CAPAN|nr:hypothetical protein T459_15403 [Capsicum annuum]